MTAYFLKYQNNSPINIGIMATTNAIRVANLSYSVVGGSAVVSRYTGAALSGGTAITPLPYRDGGLPSTVIVKAGATVSGTATVLTNSGGTADPTANPPAFYFTINPGNALFFAQSGGTAATNLSIEFVELRLTLND